MQPLSICLKNLRQDSMVKQIKVHEIYIIYGFLAKDTSLKINFQFMREIMERGIQKRVRLQKLYFHRQHKIE